MSKERCLQEEEAAALERVLALGAVVRSCVWECVSGRCESAWPSQLVVAVAAQQVGRWTDGLRGRWTLNAHSLSGGV